MSKIKQYLEQVSIELGLDGEITEEVVTEAEHQLAHSPSIKHCITCSNTEILYDGLCPSCLDEMANYYCHTE